MDYLNMFVNDDWSVFLVILGVLLIGLGVMTLLQDSKIPQIGSMFLFLVAGSILLTSGFCFNGEEANANEYEKAAKLSCVSKGYDLVSERKRYINKKDPVLTVGEYDHLERMNKNCERENEEPIIEEYAIKQQIAKRKQREATEKVEYDARELAKKRILEKQGEI